MGFDYNNLKLYRKKKGLTQEEVADRLGVSRQAVAKWEKGETVPDVENVISLADLYEVSIDFLVRNLAAQKGPQEGRKHLFGVTRINDKGQITLPKKCRSVFGIEPGDTILVLGDEDRGIALVKISEII